MKFEVAVEKFLADLRESNKGSARSWSSPLRRAAQPARARYGPPPTGRAAYKDAGDIKRAKDRKNKPYPGLGGMNLNKVTNADLVRVVTAIRNEARTRVNGAKGKGAEENARTALRVFYKWARQNGYATATPDEGLSQKKRKKIHRRAYTIEELAAVRTVLDRSRDPELAGVFFRLALETGARHAEMLAMTYGDLDSGAGTIQLVRKGFDGEYLHVPVTASLFDALEALPGKRSLGPVLDSTPILLDLDGKPITRRYFEHLCGVVRKEIPTLGRGSQSWFTTHALRHTAATIVERTSGEAVARLFLGHAASGHTQQYTGAKPHELLAAMVAIWGEPLAGHGHGYGRGEVHSTRSLKVAALKKAEAESEDFALAGGGADGEPDPLRFHEWETRDQEDRAANDRQLARLGMEP